MYEFDSTTEPVLTVQAESCSKLLSYRQNININLSKTE